MIRSWDEIQNILETRIKTVKKNKKYIFRIIL